MHCRLTNEDGPPLAGLYSLMTLRVRSLRSVGAWCRPSPRVSGGVSLASAHAATHALQPIHFVASYSSPTDAGGTEAGWASAGCSAAQTVAATATGTAALPILVMSSRRVIDTLVILRGTSGC